jgi:hypothetical protein
MRESARSLLVEIELLVDELVRLAGWGIAPHRLVTKPVLSRLAAVDPSLSQRTAGYIIERYLLAAIAAMEGTYEYQGRRYDAHTIRWGLRIALGVERGNGTAPARQYRLMKVLELDHSYTQWRRSPSNQRAFLRLLAEHMLQTSKP